MYIKAVLTYNFGRPFWQGPFRLDSGHHVTGRMQAAGMRTDQSSSSDNTTGHRSRQRLNDPAVPRLAVTAVRSCLL